jgi:hypothetical protein
MVKYNHCEKCKKVLNTEPWIGVVHAYNGICSSCMEEENHENDTKQDNKGDINLDKKDKDILEKLEESTENCITLPLERDKILLSNLEKKANEVISGESSIYVLIKEIKDDLINKANERIEETYESFDINKIEAQKVVKNTEYILEYLSDYKEYMDKLINKLKEKPSLKIKSTLGKIHKESIANLPKSITKEMLLDKKEVLKIVFTKTEEFYNFYSETEDVFELTKKMGLHPFTEIQRELSTLPFYRSNEQQNLD